MALLHVLLLCGMVRSSLAQVVYSSCVSLCGDGEWWAPGQGTCRSTDDVTCGCFTYENWDNCLDCPEGYWMGITAHRAVASWCTEMPANLTTGFPTGLPSMMPSDNPTV